MFFRHVVAVLCLLLLATLGCGPSHGHKTAPVSGVVTLDGQPFAGAKVTFQPKGGGPSSAGITNAAGEYTLIGFKGDPGAIVAEHRVVIFSGFDKAQPSADSDRDDAPARVEPIPTRYNERSELTFPVEAGKDNVATFDLTTKR